MKHLKWIARGYLKALGFIGEHFGSIFFLSVLLSVLGLIGHTIFNSWWGIFFGVAILAVIAGIVGICYGISRLNDWLQEWSKEDK